MRVWVVCLLIFIAFGQLCYAYNINIYQCQAPSGAFGFCRHPQECEGSQGHLQPSGCPDNFICCPRKSVSERKCHEYGQAVFSRHSGAAHFFPPSSNHIRGDDECNIQGVPLIVGGEEAKPKEFPHMAAIGFGVDPYSAAWQCGGSLISENFVLTAAHCTHPPIGLSIIVKLGVVDVLHDYNQNTQIAMVETIYRHPAYQKIYNDIALLKLSRPVVFTPFVRPLCLDFSGQPAESKALASGWGKTNYVNDKGNRFLMKIQLDIVDIASCTRSFKFVHRGGLRDSLMCFGYMAGGKDTCVGDSGGPLQTIRREPYCMYTLVGVTQGGHSACGSQYSPTLFTRVFSYLPWIESLVWPFEN